MLMRIVCWITKATDTNSEYVTLIASPLQQWLRERASMLRSTCIARLGNKVFIMFLSPCLHCKYVLLCASKHSSIANRFEDPEFELN